MDWYTTKALSKLLKEQKCFCKLSKRSQTAYSSWISRSTKTDWNRLQQAHQWIKIGTYYVSSTKTNPGITQGEGAYDFYSLSVSNNKVVLSSINTFQNKDKLYAKCVLSSSFDIELPNRGIVKNET